MFRKVEGFDVGIACYRLLLFFVSASHSGPKCPRYFSAACQPMPAFKRPTRHNKARTNKIFTSYIFFWTNNKSKQAPFSCMSYVISYPSLRSYPCLLMVACHGAVGVCFDPYLVSSCAAITSPWQALLAIACRMLMIDSCMELLVFRIHIFYRCPLGHGIPIDGIPLYGSACLPRGSRSVPSHIVTTCVLE